MVHRLRRSAALLLLGLAAPLFASVVPEARTPTPSPAPASAALKVMSFNVRTPADTEPGKRWEDRRAAMVQVIRQAQPAVVGTQELVLQQAQYLAEHLPDYRWFGEGRRGGTGDEHMGIFYDTRAVALERHGDFWLSDTPDVPGSISWGHPYPRMVSWGLFRQLKDGRQFYLFNTHLPYRKEDEAARVRGAQAIVEHLAGLPQDIPVVLTGDFNSEPGSPTYRAFTSALHDARAQVATPRGPKRTFHDFTGTASAELDWVLVRGLSVRSFATLDSRVDGVLPSDHFPLLVELDWPQ